MINEFKLNVPHNEKTKYNPTYEPKRSSGEFKFLLLSVRTMEVSLNLKKHNHVNKSQKQPKSLEQKA